MLGRFLSADTLVAEPGNPLGWDRYLYANANPANFNDPSGHMCSDPEDPTPTCDGGGRVNPPFEKRVTISVSSEFPLTKAEAERYMILANTRGWWNDGKLGNFSVKDYYQLLLSMEFSPLSGEYNKILPELAARDFYQRCTGYCNPNKDFDLLRYIAIKKLNTPGVGRSAAPGMAESMLNPIDFTSAITNPKEEWKTGCADGNVVCNWGNRSMVPYNIANGKTDSGALNRYDLMAGNYNPTSPYSTARITFYIMYGQTSTNPWFAFTENQSKCLYTGICQ